MGATYAALLLCLCLAPPAANAIPFLTPNVTVEYDHSAHFATRTYSWGDAQMAVPTYVDPARSIVDAQLKAKGWTLTPSGGSATVFLLGTITDGASLIAYYKNHGDNHGDFWAQDWSTLGWGAGWKPGYGESTFNALGTPGNHIVIDIFDTGSHRMFFRGVAEEDLSRPRKKTTKSLTGELKQLFKKFPKQ